MCKVKSIVLLAAVLIVLPAFALAQAQIMWPDDVTDLIIKAAYVKGTAKCNLFYKYTLDYKEANGQTYFPILTSYIPVTSGYLGKWITAALAPGDYDLRLQVYHTLSPNPAITSIKRVNVTPNGKIGASFFNLSGQYSAIANYCDYDNDAQWEIIYATGSGIDVINADGSQSVIDQYGHYYLPVAIGNLNAGDRIDDILAVKDVDGENNDAVIGYGKDGMMFAISLGTDIERNWEYERTYAYPMLKDVNGDNIDEIFIKENGARPRVIDCRLPSGVFHEEEAHAFIPADLNHDGVYRMYVSYGNQLKSYNSNWGSPISHSFTDPNHQPDNFNTWARFLSAYDIDDDNDDELIFLAPCTDNNYHIWAFNEDVNGFLSPVSSWPRNTYISNSKFPAPPVIADIGKDGDLEYMISFWGWENNYGYIYAWHIENGNPYKGTEQSPIFAQTIFPSGITQPILVDINNDLSTEVVVSGCGLVANPGQRLIAWDKNGNWLPEYTMELGIGGTDDYMFTPFINDFDQNGYIDLVLPLWEGKLFVRGFANAVHDISATPAAMYRYVRNFDSHGPSYDQSNNYICGDVNDDSYINKADINYLIAYIFQGGPPPVHPGSGDVNCDGYVNVGDMVYIVNYLIKGGPAPCDCEGGVLKDGTAAISLRVTPIDGYSTLCLNSTIDLAALELTFDKELAKNPISYMSKDIKLLRTSVGNGERITYVDLDGGTHIGIGEYNIIRIDGVSSLESASAFDVHGKMYSVRVTECGKAMLPTEFAFDQNYPNPFNPSTIFSFSLPVESEVNLTIYNILGQEIATIINKVMPAGEHRVTWEGKDINGNSVGSGVYLSKFKAGDFQSVRKISLLK
ncbi:MAG: T9SS type A sorting domain-containing protein [candidate division Zixibacteria bacterium]|nr:T9SS type A sorting domain-containing protein [candidate division Zixibacteria bacterium]